MSIQPKTPGLAAQVTEALRRVIDPELGENIVDLGMVYAVTVVGGDRDGDGDGVLVRMTTTTPGCPATGYLTEGVLDCAAEVPGVVRSEEHTSELQSLMRISYAVFCLKKKKNKIKI